MRFGKPRMLIETWTVKVMHMMVQREIGLTGNQTEQYSYYTPEKNLAIETGNSLDVPQIKN